MKQKNDHTVELFWSTALEVNNELFEIEYSKDSQKFEYLSSISGSGTSNQRNDYSFRHIPDFQGITYYRIKQIDYDGSYSYSEIRNISLTKSISDFIHPNPANEILNIASTKNDVKIHIFDFLGQRKLSTSRKKININSLNNGIYIVLMEYAGGFESRQLIIAH